MVEIKFIKTKFNTLLRHNDSKIVLNIKQCICINSIYQDCNKTWHIKVKIPKDIVNLIQDIDNKSKTFCNTEYLYSTTNEDELKIKIPYRYKKFECVFKDKNNNLLVSSDIKSNDILSINIECVNLWSLTTDQGDLSGLLWKTQLIKQM